MAEISVSVISCAKVSIQDIGSAMALPSGRTELRRASLNASSVQSARPLACGVRLLAGGHAGSPPGMGASGQVLPVAADADLADVASEFHGDLARGRQIPVLEDVGPRVLCEQGDIANGHEDPAKRPERDGRNLIVHRRHGLEGVDHVRELLVGHPDEVHGGHHRRATVGEHAVPDNAVPVRRGVVGDDRAAPGGQVRAQKGADGEGIHHGATPVVLSVALLAAVAGIQQMPPARQRPLACDGVQIHTGEQVDTGQWIRRLCGCHPFRRALRRRSLRCPSRRTIVVRPLRRRSVLRRSVLRRLRPGRLPFGEQRRTPLRANLLFELYREGEIRHILQMNGHQADAIGKLQEKLTVVVYALSEEEEGSEHESEHGGWSESDEESEPEAPRGTPIPGTTTLAPVGERMLLLHWQADQELDPELRYRIDLVYTYQPRPRMDPVVEVFSREDVDWPAKPPLPVGTPTLAQLQDAAERIEHDLDPDENRGASFQSNCCAREVEHVTCEVHTTIEYVDCKLHATAQRSVHVLTASRAVLESAIDHGWITWWEIDEGAERWVIPRNRELSEVWSQRLPRELGLSATTKACSRFVALNPYDPSELLEGPLVCREHLRPDEALQFPPPRRPVRWECEERVNACRGASAEWCETLQQRPEYREALCASRREMRGDDGHHLSCATSMDLSGTDWESTLHSSPGSGCALLPQGASWPAVLAGLLMLLFFRRVRHVHP